jgi:hypothetical protein
LFFGPGEFDRLPHGDFFGPRFSPLFAARLSRMLATAGIGIFSEIPLAKNDKTAYTKMYEIHQTL